MTDREIFTGLIAAVCGAGFFSQWEVFDRALSHFFAITFLVVGGLGLAVWLIREAWGAVQDWKAMGPPDLGPLRRKRETDREEAGRS